MVNVEGTGKIALQSSEISLKKAHQIGKKLGTWNESRCDEVVFAHKFVQ